MATRSEDAAGIVITGAPALPAIFATRPNARRRLRDFFSSHIRNRNTRRAYMEAVRQFAAFCAELGITDLSQVEAVHVAAFMLYYFFERITHFACKRTQAEWLLQEHRPRPSLLDAVP